MHQKHTNYQREIVIILLFLIFEYRMYVMNVRLTTDNFFLARNNFNCIIKIV